MMSWHTFRADNPRPWFKVSAWTICLVVALCELWSGRYYTDPDGISYLDMSDGVHLLDWHMMINAYWSPLYPFLIGVARWIIRPSAYWELPVVHLLNFVIFLGTLMSFAFLLTQAVQSQRQHDRLNVNDATDPLPELIWTLLGYSLFAWSTFVLINRVRKVNPDLGVAACIYLDAGLLLRLRTRTNKVTTALLLGLTLGLGYYVKAVLFPLAFVFMAVAFFVAGGWRRAIVPTLLMLLVFGLIAAPLVIATSKSTGHLTFGDSGSNNYARNVDGEKTLPFYSSSPPKYLIHPLTLAHYAPDVYEFGQPFKATYPLWYDVSYWDAGFKSGIHLKAQLLVLVQSAKEIFITLILPVFGAIVAYFVLLLRGQTLAGSLRNVLKSWPLILPGVAGLGLYSLVAVEPRYVAAFLVLIWIGLFSGIRLRGTNQAIKPAAITALIFAGWLMAIVAGFAAYHLVRPLQILRGQGGTYYRVAEALNAEGLEPGQAVGILGSGWDGMMWARAARLRIVAQIIPENADDFWQMQNSQKEDEVYEAFAKTGAKAVVTEETPPPGELANWQRVGGTKYYVHFLVAPTGR